MRGGGGKRTHNCACAGGGWGGGEIALDGKKLKLDCFFFPLINEMKSSGVFFLQNSPEKWEMEARRKMWHFHYFFKKFFFTLLQDFRTSQCQVRWSGKKNCIFFQGFLSPSLPDDKKKKVKGSSRWTIHLILSLFEKRRSGFFFFCHFYWRWLEEIPHISKEKGKHFFFSSASLFFFSSESVLSNWETFVNHSLYILQLFNLKK